MKKGVKMAVLPLMAVGGLALAAVLPVDKWAEAIALWARGAGWLGAVAYGAAYALATVFMLPGLLLTLGAGFAYGPLVGILIVSPASVLGATLAFVLGRSLARGWVAERVAASPRFAAVDRAVASTGFRMVLLLRLSPVFPFNLLNYALGLTSVRLRDYLAASFLGMLPGSFLYVYLGSLVTSGSQLLHGSHRPTGGAWGQALYFGGLLATLLVTALITRIARRELAAAIDLAPASAAEARR